MRISDWSSDVCSSDLWTVFPRDRDEDRADGRAQPFPVLRLLVLAAGILAIATAGNLPGAGPSSAAACCGLALLAMVGRADRSTAQPLFPSGLTSLRSRVGLGLTVKWLLVRSEEHTSELQSLMRISYAVFCLKKKTTDEISTNK